MENIGLSYSCALRCLSYRITDIRDPTIKSGSRGDFVSSSYLISISTGTLSIYYGSVAIRKFFKTGTWDGYNFSISNVAAS
jgi:hypothetical protein